MKNSAKKPTDWRTLRRLIRFIFKGYPGWLSLATLGILISAAASVASSLFLQRLIDDYILPLTRETDPNYSRLLVAVGIMAVIFGSGVLATLLYTQIMAVIGQRVQKSVRDGMFTHMQTLPLKYFDDTDTGDIMSRYTNDVDTLTQLVTQSFPQLISSALNWLFALSAMLVLSWQLSVLSLTTFGFSLLIVRWLTNRSRYYFRQQQATIGQIDAYVEEILTGLKVVKVFSHEKETQQTFDQRNQDWQTASRYANGYATMLFPIMGNMGNLLYVLVAVIGGALAINHVAALTLGTIAAFLQLSRSFSQPVAAVSQQLNAIVQAMAGTNRIFQLLDQPAEADDGTVTLERVNQPGTVNAWVWRVPQADGPDTLVPLRGAVTFDQVNFSYETGDQVLFDISFTAQPGQQVAFVGETGAGKTTITNLLNRFYDVDSGTITYDGIPITQIKKPDLRRSLAIILQDTHLFSTTIRDNIRYGRLDATDAEVQAAAHLANADTFIDQVPQGYDTVISGENTDLSKGQQQLLAIARAAVADPPVMILDEATANVDTQTERLIQTGMANLMKGRTTFAIAHRLSTIYNSDLIMVIDHGHIIEAGNHDDLMALHGTYYQLYTGAITLE